MDVIALPIPPGVRSKLLSAGFRTSADIHGLMTEQLEKDAKISHEEARYVLKVLPNSEVYDPRAGLTSAVAGAKSAWELLAAEKSRRKISTLCSEVDKILGGGVAPKELTEICGVPGIGKTQLGMQLAMSVQIPAELGGLAGDAVYIDTEGSFMVERALEMAHGMLADMRYAAMVNGKPDVDARLSRVTPDDILARIFYFRVYEYTEQIALMYTLESFLEGHPEVKLVIIDSVTFHFRQDFTDMGLRTRLLSGMAQKLMSIADRFDIAVVMVNQVTTKIAGDQSKLVPALGESWAHACTNRLYLLWIDGQRFAHIYKSPSLKSATAPYFVTSQGIRSAPQLQTSMIEG